MHDFSPRTLRRHILKMAYDAGAIHIPCALSLVNIVSALKSAILQDDDVLILSKGHGVLALYAAALESGTLPEWEARTYLKDGSCLFGLSDCHAPGCVVSSGSLGHGLPIAVGLALGLKRADPGKGERIRQVFCIVGDGELQAGPCWEAIQFASHHGLDNLSLIVDDNKLQALGETEQILSCGSIDDRLTAFGWPSVKVEDTPLEIKLALIAGARTKIGRPRGYVIQTTKGAGVPFMEDDNSWHYRAMDEAHYLTAMTALE